MGTDEPRCHSSVMEHSGGGGWSGVIFPRKKRYEGVGVYGSMLSVLRGGRWVSNIKDNSIS